MTELQINYFLEVARCLSLTKAANKFYVSQPAVSRQIVELEKELGCKLFSRVNSRIALTEAGRIFVDFFSEQKNQFAARLSLVQQMDTEYDKVIHVGILDGWHGSTFLRNSISVYKQIYPKVNVVLAVHGFKTLSHLLAAGKIDVMIDPNKCIIDEHTFNSHILLSLSQVLLYPNRLFTSKDYTPTLTDFQYDNFLIISDDEIATSIKATIRICNSYGFTPKFTIVPNIPSMMLCVQNELGVSITDEWVGTSNSAFGYIKLNALPYAVRLVWRKDSPDYIKALANIIRQEYIQHNTNSFILP